MLNWVTNLSFAWTRFWKHPIFIKLLDCSTLRHLIFLSQMHSSIKTASSATTLLASAIIGHLFGDLLVQLLFYMLSRVPQSGPIHFP